MSELIKNKNKQELGKNLLAIFVFLIAVFAVSTFLLTTYYFIDPNVTFNIDNTLTTVKVKKSKLKQFNFDIFSTEKFISLQRDTWHKYDEANLNIGNSNPFHDPSEVTR